MRRSEGACGKSRFERRRDDGQRAGGVGADAAPKGPYSPAVRAGGFVFISGQIPAEAGTGEVNRGDIREQTARALQNLRAVLEAAGCVPEQVVKTTVYLTDMLDFAAMNEVYAGFFTTAPPARTTVEVASLPLGVGVEIDAIAVG